MVTLFLFHFVTACISSNTFLACPSRNECLHKGIKLQSLKKAGESFLAISDELATASEKDSKLEMSNDIERAFGLAGHAFIKAHEAWTYDWDDVTVEFLDASKQFYQISTCYQSHDKSLQILYENIARELEDASTITGCLSVGPPASVPNLEAVRDSLYEVANLSKSVRFFDRGNGDSFLSTNCFEAADGLDLLLKEYG